MKTSVPLTVNHTNFCLQIDTFMQRKEESRERKREVAWPGLAVHNDGQHIYIHMGQSRCLSSYKLANPPRSNKSPFELSFPIPLFPLFSPLSFFFF